MIYVQIILDEKTKFFKELLAYKKKRYPHLSGWKAFFLEIAKRAMERENDV